MITYPQPVSTFNIEGQRLLNHVERNTETDTIATRYLLNHDAADLLEMIGLK